MVYRHLPEGGAGGLLVSVKGFTILRPYGYAIWENIQRLVDAELKATRTTSTSRCPSLIPENLLKKEGELVEGFAP